MKKSSGFTIIEILVAMGIIVILITMVVVVLNPPRQLAKGRNARRSADVNIILNAAARNMADNKGAFVCTSGVIPTTTKKMAAGGENYNIAPCLIPLYLDNLPYDPATTSAHYTSVADYDTGYTIVSSSTTGRVTISAPAAELGESISVTR